MKLIKMCTIILLYASSAMAMELPEAMDIAQKAFFSTFTRNKIKELQTIDEQSIQKIKKQESETYIQYKASLGDGPDYIMCIYYKKDEKFNCYRMPFIEINTGQEPISLSMPISLPFSFFSTLEGLHKKQQINNLNKKQ